MKILLKHAAAVTLDLFNFHPAKSGSMMKPVMLQLTEFPLKKSSLAL
jgi:hypothetical protein